MTSKGVKKFFAIAILKLIFFIVPCKNIYFDGSVAAEGEG